MEKALIFDIKRFATDDGPGIRTTVFFKGCPLRCTWCHSPESIDKQPELVFYENRCIRCGSCVDVCPHGAQQIREDGKRVIDWEKCNNCDECCKVCFSQALEMKGKYYTAQELLEEAQKDIVFYQESGGGVTLSGGEPTFQPAFLVDILRKCKKEGIHTALDTSGFVKWQVLREIVDYVDLFLYDIKHMSSKKHLDYTGVSNKQILENLRKLASVKKDILITVPLIPGYNDSRRNLMRTMDYIKKLGLKKIVFRPYNKSGEAKYKWLGRSLELPNLKEWDDRLRQEIKQWAEVRGLKIKIGR